MLALLDIIQINLQQWNNLLQWVDINLHLVHLIVNVKKNNFMWKKSRNVFLGDLGEWDFQIYPTMHSIMAAWLYHQIPFRIFVDLVKIFSSSPMQRLRWSSSWQKGNSWEMLLTVVTESFVLNMTAHRPKTHW